MAQSDPDRDDPTEPTKLNGWTDGGYTDATPDPDGDRPYLLADDKEGSSRIRHPESFQEAGFDCTKFADASSFRKLLWRLDLDDDPDVVACYPDRERLSRDAFVWANEELVLITGANPLTGEHGDPTVAPKDTGYASYIGIEGRPTAVENAVTLVSRYGTSKGRNRTRREYF